MTAVDRNTGQPATKDANSFVQAQTSGPSGTSTTGQSTTQTTGSSAQVQSSYALNTTPQAREALNALIQQLSDRPVIDQASAQTKFPLAVMQYGLGRGTTGGNTYYINPSTGMPMSVTEAQTFNNLQQAKQQEYISSGGMIAGGTIEQKAQQANRQQEISRNRETQGKYSKEAAIADSKALGDYFTRILTEQQMPGILRGAEGAGASQGTTRALLTEQAIARNAESAAKTGIDASVAYGGINNQLAGVLEMLTRSDPNSTVASLLQALNAAKGIETSGVQSTAGATQQTQVTNQTQQQAKGGEVSFINRDFATGGSSPGYSIAPPPAYTPSSQAGTGYVQRNADPAPTGNGISIYGDDDSNVIFED